jgi:tRNA pseudouridine32 synthase / 23S rRNA pseudouridine746 synthase
VKPKRRHAGTPAEVALPNHIRARILHEDRETIILDKPAGLAVHAGPRGGASLEDWLPALQQGRRHPPQPAHRLDMDTAGCLALGRTKPAIAALNKAFAEGLAQKTYWAVLIAPPPTDTGLCEAPLLKTSTRADGWRMVVNATGQSARTEWRVLGRDGARTAIELTPRTGRTHQLRAHMAHLGCPILGDARYGGGAGAIHLLARRLVLPGVAAQAPLPDHMRNAWAACGVR